MGDTISPEWRDHYERRERELEVKVAEQDAMIQHLRSRIDRLVGLLGEADRAIVWETAMPDGAAFQNRIEAALRAKK